MHSISILLCLLLDCLSQRLWSLHQGAVEQALVGTGTATQPSQTQPSQVQAEGEDEDGSSSNDELDGDEAGPSQVCFTTLGPWLHTFSPHSAQVSDQQSAGLAGMR